MAARVVRDFRNLRVASCNFLRSAAGRAVSRLPLNCGIGLREAITSEHRLLPRSPATRLGELVMHVGEGRNLACT